MRITTGPLDEDDPDRAGGAVRAERAGRASDGAIRVTIGSESIAVPITCTS